LRSVREKRNDDDDVEKKKLKNPKMKN